MRTPALVSAAAVLAMAAALSACAASTAGGKGGISAGQPSVNASAPISVPPSAPGSVSPTGTATSTATSAPTQPVAVPTFGTTPQQYATIAVDAYVHGNSALVADYGDVHGDSFGHLGHPDEHWHYHATGDDGLLKLVTFDNNVGDRLSVDVDPTLLGKPHAIHSTSIDRVEFSSNANDLVGFFIGAWEDGNRARMATIATSSLAGQFDLSHPPTNEMVISDDTTTEPGHTLVQINTDIGGYTFDVVTSKLGHAHAIIGTK